MARELITSWGDYQTAIDQLLALAQSHVCIFDQDLALLHLDSSPRQNRLRHILRSENAAGSIRIALRDAAPLQRQNPLLIGLLASFGHRLAMRETPSSLAHLRDSLILVDDQYALIRFERNLPRSKLLINEPEELKPYLARFEEIWREEGSAVSATTLGL